jgi:SAM-dependent methyltransferase
VITHATKGYDPVQLRAQAWAERQEAMSRPLFAAVLDLVHGGPDVRLLDVGCGTGLAVQLASKRGTTVTGIDIADTALTTARARTPNAKFRVADLQVLPFPDRSFDVVVGFNSFQFARDPAAAFCETMRVARVGGQIAAAVWAMPDRCESAATLMAVRSLLPSSGSGDPFALSQPGVIEALMERADIQVTVTGEVHCPWEYADAEAAWWAWSLSAPGTVVRAIRQLGEEAVRRAVLASLQPFRQPAGGYRQENIFRYVIGEV